VLVKSFALEQTEGEESSRRWIETRFLTKQDGEWAGYSYIWNDEQTDAELVAAEGLDRNYKMKVPVSSEHPDGIKTQKWHYPSRVECMVCHSRAANFVLGLSTAQMNKEHDYGGAVEHQLRVLEQLDLVKNRGGKQASAVDPSKLAKLANPYDENEPLEIRARSYLHANCSICHMQAGGGNAQMDLEFSAATRKFNVIDVPPLHHKFGIEDARLIAPGHPERSVLLYRMAHRGEGSGQMPQLATRLIDERAVKLFEAWIRNMQPEN